MSTSRSLLREELTARLIPELKALGFAGPRSISGNSIVHEFKRTDEGVIHVLTVQLEKHGLPRFIINMEIQPPEGYESLVKCGGTILQGIVKPGRGVTTRSWFRADPPLWRRLLGQRESRHADVVSSCLALLPEIEQWWHTQAPSSNIMVHRTTFPGKSDSLSTHKVPVIKHEGTAK